MDTYSEAGNPDDIALGRALISAGKVGCIVLAGGDGSRLGWAGPKGSFPISLVKQKTLFQLLLERIEAASNHFEEELKVAAMTSPLNHEVSEKALGHRVELFTQNVLPILGQDQAPLEEERPNGNGEVLKRFYHSGIYQKWKKAGVELVTVVLIDNPLAEPFDPNQIGIHYKNRAEVTLKAVKKKSPDENVGVIGKKEGRICVVEYSENPPPEWNLANISLFSFSMEFIAKVKEVELPVHNVKKFIDTKPVFKQETFIFDLLPHSEKTEVIVYPRTQTFAPLKDRKDVGPVQKALFERDKKVFTELTGQEPGESIFELDAQFHFPTDAIRQKWRGVPLPPSSYISP